VMEAHLNLYRCGAYQSFEMGDRHQVKRIVVRPGGRLSLAETSPPLRTDGSWYAAPRGHAAVAASYVKLSAGIQSLRKLRRGQSHFITHEIHAEAFHSRNKLIQNRLELMLSAR
jgi:hypothetical protein